MANSSRSVQRVSRFPHTHHDLGLMPNDMTVEKRGDPLPYDPAEVEPLKEVAKIAPRACLFIHGLRDRTCDPEDSVRLYEAAGDPKGLWLLEGAGHCDGYFLDRETYCDRVAAFLEEHL